MITVITTNQVTEREPYLLLAKAFAKDVVQYDGCLYMTVEKDMEHNDTVVYISHWNSKEDFQRHVQGETFAKHIPGMGKYYKGGTDCFLEEA